MCLSLLSTDQPGMRGFVGDIRSPSSIAQWVMEVLKPSHHGKVQSLRDGKREMENTTAKLGSVGSVRLPGWGPRDAPNTWLETLRDMAMNRTQWRTCCHALALNSC